MTPIDAQPSAVIIKKLQRIRSKGRVSDRAFATQLGVTNAAWSRIQSGKRQIGLKFLSAVVRNYPRLRRIAMKYLTEEAA